MGDFSPVTMSSNAIEGVLGLGREIAPHLQFLDVSPVKSLLYPLEQQALAIQDASGLPIDQVNFTLLFSKLKDVTIPMLLISTSANELLTCTKLPTQQKAPPEPFGDVLPLHTVTPELFVLSSRETFLQRALVHLSELCFTQVVSNFTQIKGSLCELAGIFVYKKE